MVTHQGLGGEAVSKRTHGNGERICNLKRIRVGVQSRTTNSVHVIEWGLGRGGGVAGKSKKDKSNRFRSGGGGGRQVKQDKRFNRKAVNTAVARV